MFIKVTFGVAYVLVHVQVHVRDNTGYIHAFIVK